MVEEGYGVEEGQLVHRQLEQHSLTTGDSADQPQIAGAAGIIATIAKAEICTVCHGHAAIFRQ